MDIASIASGGLTASVIGGLFVLLQLWLNKRLRTPADRLADAQFSVKVYQDQVAEARADKALNDQTIQTLREYAEKLEKDGREDQKLIIDLYQQIGALERRNREKDDKIHDLQHRIDKVAAKVARGEVITLSDLDVTPIGDLEDTLNRDQLRARVEEAQKENS